MNLNSMFAIAKKINNYNKVLTSSLSHPLNQIKIAQIIDKKVIFVVENSSILNLAKGQTDLLLALLNDKLDLNIDSLEFKLKIN